MQEDEKKNNGGRLSAIDETVEASICMYLLDHEGRATWKELKGARGEGKKEIHDGVLGAALKKLTAGGVVTLSAELREDGKAVTVYHFHPRAHTAPLNLSDMLRDAKIVAFQEHDPEERAMEASNTMFVALQMIALTVNDEIVLFSESSDKEKALERYNSVLKNYILPLLRRLPEVAEIPGACDPQYQEAIESITVGMMTLHNIVAKRGAAWFDERIDEMLNRDDAKAPEGKDQEENK